jgi:hypothetical protein
MLLFDVLIAGLIAGTVPALWVLMLCLVPLIVFSFREPRSMRGRSVRDNTSKSNDSADRSNVEELVWTVIGVMAIGWWPFALAFSAWEFLTWLASHFSGESIAGFRPSIISSYKVGWIFIVICLGGWAVSAIWTGYKRKLHPRTRAENRS